MADLEVEKQALLSDAKVWHRASDDLDDPTKSLEPLTLDGARDVMGLGERLGIDSTYEQARTKMSELLDQASSYFDDLASALVDIGKEYENSDSEYADKLDRLKQKLEDD